MSSGTFKEQCPDCGRVYQIEQIHYSMSDAHTTGVTCKCGKELVKRDRMMDFHEKEISGPTKTPPVTDRETAKRREET